MINARAKNLNVIPEPERTLGYVILTNITWHCFSKQSLAVVDKHVLVVFPFQVENANGLVTGSNLQNDLLVQHIDFRPHYAYKS